MIFAPAYNLPVIELAGTPLSLETLAQIGAGATVKIADSAKPRVEASRATIEAIVAKNASVYGVTTGFGKLADIPIPPDRLAELQVNLVRSHACGVGQPLPSEEVRVMMALRANVLAVGCSGIRLEVLQTLVDMLNADVLPIIPEQGSVGASGDLAPLAHLAMGVIGEGSVRHQGTVRPAASALADAGISAVQLEAKEGLALLNGTQALCSVGALAVCRAVRAAEVANIAGALTLEALMDTPAAFDERIMAVRPHRGQARCAGILRSLIEGSEIRESHRTGDARVQDAYSIRCMPQVHGAVWDALDHVRGVIEIESGSATDNPLVFSESGDVISGGNFHGAALAYAFDYAAIVTTDLSSISERRIERLVNPALSEGLPPFLSTDAGVSSGFMIPQVVAAALLNECKVLSHPASVDNVPTSAGKEDHVSMGMVAATKLRRIVDNTEKVLAIELIAACEGIEHRRPLRSSEPLERAHAAVRAVCPKVNRDRSLSADIEAVQAALPDILAATR